MKHTTNYTSFMAISVVALLLILLVHPTLSSIFFPWKRAAKLNEFVAKIQKTNTLDPQEFWQWREMYYPGSITFTRIPKEGQPHTVFQSSFITSSEYLVDAKSNKVGFTVQNSESGTKIVFMKPISEMRTANGFFDYKDKDKKLLEGKLWLVQTLIRD